MWLCAWLVFGIFAVDLSIQGELAADLAGEMFKTDFMCVCCCYVCCAMFNHFKEMFHRESPSNHCTLHHFFHSFF